MEVLEDMQIRHRKEQKDLQARIIQKKKGSSKKTRKGVTTECEELEHQLKEKQEQERRTLDGESAPDLDDVPELDKDEPTDGVKDVAEILDKTAISEKEEAKEEDGQPKKRNRQKERLARRAAEQDAAIEEAKKEAAKQPDPKAIEREIMLKEFKSHGLTEKLIRPDGHCLFSAVADQLSQVRIPLGWNNECEKEGESYKVVRKAAARYIEGHPDGFAEWLDEPLDKYVEKIRDTAEWGGHLELLALAKTYNVEICVIQDGGTQKIAPGEGKGDLEKIWLAYYRHGFGLGEHYNSLRKSP